MREASKNANDQAAIFLVQRLIGWEHGARFLDQSWSKVK